MIKLLDFKKLHIDIENDLVQAATNVIKSGQYILGSEVEKFESRVTELFQVKYALGVGNGTDALQIALKALGIKEGNEVITTSFTYYASAECIASIGAIPVFADVCYETYNIDPKSIESKITNKTKAIITVDLFGNPVDYRNIKTIADKHNLKWISDACQAISAEYNGKKISSQADITCFSLFPTKNLGALGDAGLITTEDESLYIIMKALSRHGSGSEGAKAHELITGEKYNLKNSEDIVNPAKYYNFLVGYNSRLDALQAAMLNVKIEHLEEWSNKRRENAQYIINNYKGTAIQFPKETENAKQVFHQFTLKSKIRNEIIVALNEANIQTAIYYPIPLHLQVVFSDLKYKNGDLPISEKLCNEVFSIPVAPELKKEDLDKILEVLNRF